mmetsp:Transcript_7626/g.11552  ORF Transcript_7626/g.11552 Transcript_7626/m.11552 type:complete len:96 (+) Transcript_7626:289-576(+)
MNVCKHSQSRHHHRKIIWMTMMKKHYCQNYHCQMKMTTPPYIKNKPPVTPTTAHTQFKSLSSSSSSLLLFTSTPRAVEINDASQYVVRTSISSFV